jgi:hypothetical protein
MGFYRGPNIVTDGLVYAIDAGSTRSYPGSGTVVTDLIGSNTGALTNGVAFSTDNGGTWDFDGADDYITASRTLSTSNYSAEFVFKADVNTTGTEHWLGSQYPGTGRIIFDLDTNNVLRNFCSGTSINGSTTIVTGNWYHAVFTRNSSGVAYIYLNGVQDATGTISTATPVNDPFEIGGSTTLTRWFNGKIPFCRIYNKVLTAAEALQNFNAQKSRFGL